MVVIVMVVEVEMSRRDGEENGVVRMMVVTVLLL